MKKILLLLLLWVSGMTAQVSNGNEMYSDYGFRSDPAQLQIPISPNYLSTVGADGTFGKIEPVNLPWVLKTASPYQIYGTDVSGTQTTYGISIPSTNSSIVQRNSIGQIFGSGMLSETTAKANGEQFYTSSGESVYGKSNEVIEAQLEGTGTDFTPSNTIVAIKFTTSSTVSFVQSILLRVKKTGSLTATSNIVVKLYSNSGGVPGTQIGSSGLLYSGRVSASYTEIPILFQNIQVALLPNTVYWATIQRTVSGGAFVFDSTSGSGSTYQGATFGTVTDTGSIIGYKIMARSNYGGHFVGDYSHGVWGTSKTGVGVRGDSEGHFGGYFTSIDDIGSSSVSINNFGVLGTSTNNAGVSGVTYSSIGFPAITATNTNGSTFLALQVNGRGVFTGTTAGIAGVSASDFVIKSQLDLKADLASPALTGTPTAPTPTAGTNTTQLATTAFVTAADANNLKTTGNQIKTGDLTVNNLFLPLQPLSSGIYNLSAGMSNTDFWKIYGYGTVSDQGIMVFEVGDNGAPFASNGQKFEFRYGNTSSGTAKTPLTVDYNEITALTNITANSFVASSGTIRLKNYTVATLPSGTQGDTAFVTDALAPTYLTTVVGGGAVVTPVFYNGTNWVAH